ncbi:hypothetical protein JAAARDRAFT_179466 [Jaapia argillacea MUCL 33604]|uniref:Cytochrome P450 n=1 Tax=Jaapia argillacea MUCL 33604 TaxID=933084 RepID=A0A067Q2G4_9AGAM|nr:hypothetical protein JAAARDRAFT_179466 [Jaapia argillacea MUCL 33604]
MLYQPTFIDFLVLLAGTYLSLRIIRNLRLRGTTPATPLKGPPNTSPFNILGLARRIARAPDTGALLEQWAEEYGSVYQIPAALGTKRVILTDPKAIAHFYSHETFGYVQPTFGKMLIENIVGRGLLWAEGEAHKRQRRAIAPAFTNAAIRKVTDVFYDSAYKLKDAWDTIIEAASSDEAIIEVQTWMNHVSLDSIGIAGFSHDFGSLHGKYSTVANVFDSFSTIQPTLIDIIPFILGPIFPFLINIPTERNRMLRKLNASMEEISEELLSKTRENWEGEDRQLKEEKSLMGVLIKSETTESGLRMSKEEVLAQMKVLMLAGYETSSITLTWALIELCRNPQQQTKLREELQTQCGAGDPTWEEFTNGLPYLDAVVHETLRHHPPLDQTNRIAAEDDIIPLSVPLQLSSGVSVDRVSISKGTRVTIPIMAVNRSTSIWGPDAKVFSPERWLDETNSINKFRAKEIQGHRHLLTFVDGPRTCLGKGFALAEIKAVLSVLIRNYSFEFRDGPETQIEKARGILPRPKVAGESGYGVPLRVRRLR